MDKGLLLLSGGIDSPIAGYLVRNKIKLNAIHFSQEPFTDSSAEQKSLASAKLLGINKLTIINSGKYLQKIADTTYREYYFVLMKIFFMKVSEIIAKEKKIKYLITGESLGQVSSQTLSNLNTINSQTKIEIIRPLLFLGKQEIIDISREKDFFEISSGPEMCDTLASGKPKTITKIQKIKIEMEKCSMDKLIETAAKDFVIKETKDISIEKLKKINSNTCK